MASEHQREIWRRAKRKHRATMPPAQCRSCAGPRLDKNGALAPDGWKSLRCWKCIQRDHRRLEERMSGSGASTQDLSAYPNLARGELPGGFRYVSGFLPWPACTKHTRTALTAKAGFRPLVKAAKQYQQFVAQAVLVNDLIDWIRPGTEYILEVICFGHRSDNDQYTGGLQDDLVKSGLMADDKDCEATISRRLRIPKDQEKKIFIAVYETQKGVQ